MQYQHAKLGTSFILRRQGYIKRERLRFKWLQWRFWRILELELRRWKLKIYACRLDKNEDHTMTIQSNGDSVTICNNIYSMSIYSNGDHTMTK